MSVASDAQSTQSPQDAPNPTGRRPRIPLTELERWALVAMLIGSFTFFALNSTTSETFLSAPNLRNVLGSQAVIGVLALASLAPLIAREFDLSVGAICVLASIVMAKCMADLSMPLALSIVVGLGVGAAIGLMNGWLVAYLRVNALIATLGVSTVIGGVIQWITEGNSIVSGISADLVSFGAGNWFGLPRTVYALALVGVLIAYVLVQTPYGRYLHFVGSNPASTRLVGVNVRRTVLGSFVISGLLSGLAGALLIAQNGNATPQTGGDLTLTAISAAFLGATAIRPGRFNVIGTIVAIYFLAFSINGLTLLGVEAWINNVFTGAALVIAVAVAALLGRRGAEA
jgi:ribose transport system permease protein